MSGDGTDFMDGFLLGLRLSPISASTYVVGDIILSSNLEVVNSTTYRILA